MFEEISKDRQLEATIELAAELRSMTTPRASGMSGKTETPRAGDTFVSRRTAEYPVEWLVTEANGDGRVRVVALDHHPFVGSRDMVLPERSPGDDGVLRLDFDAGLAASELEAEFWTGGLTETQVEEVQRRCRTGKKGLIAGEEGTLEVSLLEEEVDGDPEYVYWRERVLRPALAALTGTAENVGVEEDVGPVIAAASRFRRWRPMLLAASVLFAVALPLVWQVQQLSRELEGERTRVAEADRDRSALTERLADSESEAGRLGTAMEELRETTERALAEQGAQVEARLRRALDGSVVLNVPAFVLARVELDRARRGLAEVIDPGRAPRFTLSLQVNDPEPYLEYRLQVVEKDGGREVWSTDGLVKVSGKWLRLDLPTDLLEPVEYELLIHGLGLGEPRLLTERYAVKFER